MIPSTPSNKITYNDKLIWLAGYPVAALSFIFFANDNSFVTLINLPTFLSDLFFAIAVTFAIGFYIRWLTRYLDIKLPWYEGFKSRLFRQVLLGIVMPLLVSMLLEVVYLYFANIPLATSSILNLEFPLAFIFLLLANLFYLVSYLFYHKRTEVITITRQVTISAPKPIEYITVQKGFTEERVDIENCAVITSSSKLLWLHTYNGQQYRLQGTLEEWEEKLKSANFYRINRQYLAALNAVRSVEQTDTRKLKVNLVIPADEVFVSKLNVASFRQWWKKGSPS